MKAYCDGACRVSNPGECSAAFYITDGHTVSGQWSSYLGPELHTNNYAEYQGLLHLLRYLDAFGHKGVDIYCDSKLVVNQVMDVWDVNSAEIKPLWLIAYTLRVRGNHTVHHIKGHSGDPGNEYVDKLCNQALDEEFLRRDNGKNETKI